jgi:membrane associated rhomboid family serine protease
LVALLIPLRTDQYPRRRPIVTEALIIANLLVFLAGLAGHHFQAFDIRQFIEWGHFDPQRFKWWQLFTALFVHDPSGIWHVLFNMLALWVFGPPVEGRLSRFAFLGFYLMAGAVANLAHMIADPIHSVIGASGAIAGVTGIFLALFPRSHILVFFIFTMSVLAVPSLWLIGLYFIIDVMRQVGELLGAHGSRVAFMAHIAGYIYGFATGFVLLGAKVIPRGEWDVFFLFKQWRRRAAMRAANRGSVSGAWESASADTGKRLEERQRTMPAPSAEDDALARERADIQRLAAQHDLPEAAARYRALLRKHPEVILSEQRQVEIANQLAAEGDHVTAAAAYELLLTRFPQARSAAEIRLMLGLLYTRQLRKPDRARELIEGVRAALTDSAQRRLADQLLTELA